MSLSESALELRLSLEAAGAVVAVSTVLSLWHLLAVHRSGVFNALKCAMYLLTSFPAAYAWLSLAYAADYSVRAELALGMNLSRCVALLAFWVVLEGTIGRSASESSSSDGQMLAVLVSIESVPPWLFGAGGWSLATVDEAKRFVRWMKAGVLQHVLVLALVGTVEIVLERAFETDRLHFAECAWGEGWTYIAIGSLASACLCGYALASFGQATLCCPDKRATGLFRACVLTALLTVGLEAQGLFLALSGEGSGSAQTQGFLGAVEGASAALAQGWVWLPLRGLDGASRAQTVRSLMEQRDFSQVELAAPGRGCGRVSFHWRNSSRSSQV